MARRTLFSWIGHSDALAMAACQKPTVRDEILKTLKTAMRQGRDDGPIRTLLKNEEFSNIHLLSNFPASINRHYATWLDRKVTIHKVELVDPTDYERVFEVTDAVLREVTERRRAHEGELCMLLTPGTPAMAAILLLLGKSRYPSRFFQTYEGKAWEAKIPFDLLVDFIPDVMREPDSTWLKLSLQMPRDLKGFATIVGESKAIQVAVARAQRAAIRNVPVLILGETGTGKELFARAIHEASGRHKGKFKAINCAAVPETLLEAELFGYVEGAFTDARHEREGAFKHVDNGTLLLDEVGECSPRMQGKLLRALQPSPGAASTLCTFNRVGSPEEVIADVRIIAATNRDLRADVAQGRFREDLFYRLAVITLKLPPLRERSRDIPNFVDNFLTRINEDFAASDRGYKPKSCSKEAMRRICRHRWPGNVRELWNVLVQAAAMSNGSTIEAGDIRAAIEEIAGGAIKAELCPFLEEGFSLAGYLDDVRRACITRAMEEAGGVMSRAIRLLGIKNYQNLALQMERLGMKRMGHSGS